MPPLLSESKATILLNPTSASLKRLAWAYGVAKKNSEDERVMLGLLIDKIRHEYGDKL